MKFKEKVLSAILCCTLLMGGTVFARENVDENFIVISEQIVTLNEFDIFNQMKEESDQNLRASGYTDQEINFIREKDIIDIISEKSSFSDEELLDQGYSKKQIESMRKYLTDIKLRKESDVDLKSIGGEMEATFKFAEEVKPSTRGGVTGDVDPTAPMPGQRFRVYTSWNWSAKPFWTSNDILAVGWGGIDTLGNVAALEVDKNRTYHDVTYTHPVYSSETHEVDMTYEHIWKGVYSDWPIQRGSYLKFAEKGIMCVQLDNKGVAPIKRFFVTVKYGHGSISFSPSASFSGDGFGVGISINGAQTVEWQDSFAFDESGRP